MKTLGLYSVFIILFLSGCATINPDEEVFNEEAEVSEINYEYFPEPERVGVYHKVLPGETLWRIARTYNVGLSSILVSNNIPDAAMIEKNQLVFIPGAREVLEVSLEEDTDKSAFVWPIDGEVVRFFKQRFSNRMNHGIHIKSSPGEIVRAARAGEVVFADFLPGYEYTVIIDHKDGLYSIYAKNEKLLVKAGRDIQKYAPIGFVASYGNDSYLDFQIRRNAVEYNPLHYLP